MAGVCTSTPSAVVLLSYFFLFYLIFRLPFFNPVAFSIYRPSPRLSLSISFLGDGGEVACVSVGEPDRGGIYNPIVWI